MRAGLALCLISCIGSESFLLPVPSAAGRAVRGSRLASAIAVDTETAADCEAKPQATRSSLDGWRRGHAEVGSWATTLTRARRRGKTSQSSLANLKGSLLRSAVGVNRGLSCREGEEREIADIVEQLEGRNPNTTPNDGFAEGTSILSGEWKLIFTNALDVLSLGLLPGVEVGQIFQNISPDGTEIANIVDLQPKAAPVFERFTGNTSARLKVLAASSVEGDKRITLAFRSSQYSPQTLLGRDVSSRLPPLTINFPQLFDAAGWIDTTYVDDDIRVARAFGGNFFVLARV